MGSRSPLFRTSVDKLLGSWKALTLALQHGQGGGVGNEIASWMRTVVEDFFYQNDDLEGEEVAEFVGEIMNAELDTLVEDGTLGELGTALCHHFRLSLDTVGGGQGELVRLHGELDKALMEQGSDPPAVSNGDSSSSDDDEGDSDEAMETESGDCQGPSSSSGVPPTANQHHRSGHNFVSEPDDEGWATVCKSKRK